ncbi:MAG: GNAT family N-acetyltransferase [Microbacterium ginsengisoli]|uniref:GNAT family N-acetyltransferase n=2 Tax=Microbacteriaceae TaxID=85023 RepID=UPI0006F1CC93|nr:MULTISPECIES: GNAT family N-acetyltransferase [unclassified Microbacterium]KQS05518.1 hypothetical protein ASF93_00760 [Microbacterium sp. Leaf347]MBN9197403.1 GNAT family N-acetyltransferase [Microbacterium ginsengisoli]ODU78416.1 MAG: hypothetical protein ABT08_04145 [Microbacterium sp. SCN 71-21]OJU77316.1 MAG: hypothetical protein BGO15_07610 [Microbacterium sp. 71-23]
MTDVSLTPWRDDHLPVLIAANTPEMTVYLGGPETDDEVRARHAKYLRLTAAGEAWMFAIEREGTAIGGIGFWPSDLDGAPVYEAGWHVLPPWQGNGYAGAALRALVKMAPTIAAPRSLIVAFPSIENDASNGVCRAAGFTALDERDSEYRGVRLHVRVWTRHFWEPLTAAPSAP